MIGNFEDPRKVFGNEVCAAAMKDERIVLLSADSGKSSGFGEFMRACPNRYFEFGIMEQTMTGAAAGLATTGKIPVICAIAPFVTARNFEMFRNDIGYMRQNVKIVGRNGGITYSDLGSTHHSLDDFALAGVIPGVLVLSPQDPNEIRAATKAMLSYDGPVYMRIGNAKQENLFEDGFELGKARQISVGQDVSLISTGSMTSEAKKAAGILRECEITVDHIGISTLTPIDAKAITTSAEKTGLVFVVEESYPVGGLSSRVAEVLAEAGSRARLIKVSLPHEYALSGPYEQVLNYYGLSGEKIAQTVKRELKV